MKPKAQTTQTGDRRPAAEKVQGNPKQGTAKPRVPQPTAGVAPFLPQDNAAGEDNLIPGITNDPILKFLLTGAAQTLHEAEEMYLDASLPALLELLGGPATNEELSRHPLLNLLLTHGSRGWEDSIL
jgi:hypothetical protein